MASRIVALGLFLAACACLVTPSLASKESLTINFYAQEYFLTGTATTVFLVPPLGGFGESLAQQKFLGAVSVVDPAITTGTDPESTIIGRLKGFSVFGNTVNPNAPDVEAVWTVVFNEASGFAKGSTISFRGLYETLSPERELSISGGTGQFRLAQGWVVVTTHFLDPQTGRAINNFTVHVRLDKSQEVPAHPGYTSL